MKRALACALVVCCAILGAGCASTDEPGSNGGHDGGGGDGGGGESEAETSTIEVQNATSYTIAHIYMSPTAQSSWGRDLLGRDVLPPGQACRLTGIEPGTWDIRCETSDGREFTLLGRRIDLGEYRLALTNADAGE